MSFSIGRTVQINRNGFITLGLLFCITVFIFYAFNYSDNINIIWNSKKSNVKLNEFINLKDLLSASIDAAQRGGVKVVEVRENASLLKEKSKGKTLEGVNDPVTDGDMKSHIEMYYSLKNLFPRITIVSEEKSAHKQDGSNVAAANINRIELESLANIDDEYVKAADIQIWIDPLDATQEYTENLKQYVTTMVCVAVKGIPTIGVIHKPFEGLTSWAWVDRAHNPLLKVSEDETTDPTGSVKVIVSRSHKGEVVSKAQKAFGDVSVTSAGGAGFKTLEVLSGRQDVYFHSTLIKKWDICAGNAILKHFKGHMTTLEGKNIDYSDPFDYKNPYGLVASLKHHSFYLKKLQSL